MRHVLMLICLVPLILAQYENSKYIRMMDQLDMAKLREEDNDDFWMIQLYKAEDILFPQVETFITVAKALSGHVHAGAINVEHTNIIIPFIFGIKKIPAVVFLPYRKSLYSVIEYETSKDLIDSIGKKMEMHFKEQIMERYIPSKLNTEIALLSTQTVGDFLNKSVAAWGIVFYDKKCKKCQTFASVWESTINDLHEKIQFGSVNSNGNDVFQIDDINYPKIQFYPRRNQLSVTYEGELNTPDVIKFFESHLRTPKVIEIIEDETFKLCAKRKYCIITMLPNDQYCDFNCTKTAINLLKNIGKKYKKYSWAFLWSQYHKQFTISDFFNISETTVPTIIMVKMATGQYQRMTLGPNMTISDTVEMAEKMIKSEGFDKTLVFDEIPHIRAVDGVKGLSKLLPKDEL